MKTLAIGLVLCIAFFIAMIPASTQTVPQGVIRGNVYDAETGSPVEGATVTCRGEANGILQKTTITDSYGYFEFKTLKVDETYGITVEHENYETESKPVFPSHSEPQISLRFELPITPPKPTTTIPAFQIIPAIMALLAVAYLMRRRK